MMDLFGCLMRLLSAYFMYRSASDLVGYDTMSFNNDVVDYHYCYFFNIAIF